jgi:hypothetical protein
VIHETLEIYPDDAPPFLDTPYGYHDTERLRADLAEAGWQDPQLEEVSIEVVSDSAADVAAGYVRGTPLEQQVLERGGDVEAVERAVGDALGEAFGSRPFKSPTTAIVVSARR